MSSTPCAAFLIGTEKGAEAPRVSRWIPRTCALASGAHSGHPAVAGVVPATCGLAPAGGPQGLSSGRRCVPWGGCGGLPILLLLVGVC